MENSPEKKAPPKSNKDREQRSDLGTKVKDIDGGKSLGRQSAISGTVNKREIAERILDLTMPMSIREIMETSKDLCAEFQDLIRLKNVKAVLLGRSTEYPMLANLGWPRTDGVLIKIDLETGSTNVCAIIDTGSQLNVTRSDIAALKIKRTVDM
ncbi:hypothetical protein C8R43DRAFT_885447, partial [Mycena crocata]